MRYNCSILDLFDRSIVRVNGAYINTELAKKALKSRSRRRGLILHSDQDSQLTSWGFYPTAKKKGNTKYE